MFVNVGVVLQWEFNRLCHVESDLVFYLFVKRVYFGRIHLVDNWSSQFHRRPYEKIKTTKSVNAKEIPFLSIGNYPLLKRNETISHQQFKRRLYLPSSPPGMEKSFSKMHHF